MLKLIVIGDLPAAPVDQGVFISKKFVTGMRRYAELWPGEVTALLQASEKCTEDLDVKHFSLETLGFGLKTAAFDSDELRAWLREERPNVVLGGANYQLLDLGDICRSIGAKFVCCTEYTLRTNLQISAADNPSLLGRAKSSAWLLRHELRTRALIKKSAGLQCNGTPTFDAYRELNPNPLAYFDSRISKSMVAGAEHIEARLRRIANPARPATLLFSGRLNAMKGANHLVGVADALRSLDVRFRLLICGDGPLAPHMKAEAERRGLEQHIEFRGVLDFERELVPLVRDEADLFLCCHVQGDPSCTYLETAACGVPIAGYANEAFRGILRRYPIGVAAPVGQSLTLAKEIRALLRSPGRMASMANAAVKFAEENTFDEVFAQRIDHLLKLASPQAATKRTFPSVRWGAASASP